MKTDKELIDIIEEIIERKSKEDERIIIFTFFEVHIRKEVSREQEDRFIDLATNRLENLGYTVYLEGEKFVFDFADRRVQDNQIIVAIKK